MQGFDCRLDEHDHDFCAGGTVAVFVILVRQLSIGIRRDDDLKAVVVSVGAKSRQRRGPNPAKKQRGRCVRNNQPNLLRERPDIRWTSHTLALGL
jgi:hypothetical protein